MMPANPPLKSIAISPDRMPQGPVRSLGKAELDAADPRADDPGLTPKAVSSPPLAGSTRCALVREASWFGRSGQAAPLGKKLKSWPGGESVAPGRRVPAFIAARSDRLGHLVFP